MASKERIFKNTSGAHYLKALFFEMALEDDKRYVLYSLKNYDNNGVPSIHRLFVEYEDLTEYEFAKEYFDSWQHWKMIKECSWFKPVYEEMKEELELKIKARSLNRIKRLAEKDDSKDAMQANRYLLEKGWIDKEDKRGRPSKAKIKEEAEKVFKDAEIVSGDYERIVLNG